MGAHSSSRLQAALALACWDQSQNQVQHYPLLRKQIRKEPAMRALQKQWRQVTMPGWQALRKALSAAAATGHFRYESHQDIKNTCHALKELDQVFMEALPLLMRRPDHPLRHLPSVQAITCSPGWPEYSNRVQALEARSGGDALLKHILELQREADSDEDEQDGAAATTLVHATELAPVTYGMGATAMRQHMQQPASAAGSTAVLAAEIRALRQQQQQQLLLQQQQQQQQQLLLQQQQQQQLLLQQLLGMPGMPGTSMLAAGMPHALPAALPMHAAQLALPCPLGMAPMQRGVSMYGQQLAATAPAAATAGQQAPGWCNAPGGSGSSSSRQPAPKHFRLSGNESCSQLYTIFQRGINGFPSWRHIKEDAQAQGIPLHSTDRKLYSSYKPIVEAAGFAMQHSGMTEAQALQALDSMQRQLAPRQPRGSSAQRQQVGVSDIAYGFAWVQSLDTQVKALAQQAASGGKLQLPGGFKAKEGADRGSNTMIRNDMSAAQGITVWDFIQSAAAHRLCPQRAKEQWFDSRLPSMQKALKKRGRDQD
jgi:hypothetical protein